MTIREQLEIRIEELQLERMSDVTSVEQYDNCNTLIDMYREALEVA